MDRSIVLLENWGLSWGVKQSPFNPQPHRPGLERSIGSKTSAVFLFIFFMLGFHILRGAWISFPSIFFFFFLVFKMSAILDCFFLFDLELTNEFNRLQLPKEHLIKRNEETLTCIVHFLLLCLFLLFICEAYGTICIKMWAFSKQNRLQLKLIRIGHQPVLIRLIPYNRFKEQVNSNLS